MRINQAATEWLRTLSVAPSTRSDYESVVRTHIIPLWGAIRVPKLTRELITSALPTVSPGRRQRVVAVLRLILAYHGTDTSCFNRVFQRHPSPKRLTVPNVEAVVALSHRMGPDGDVVLFAAGSGLRWGELVALQPEDIEGDVVSVTKAWCARSHAIKGPKSAAGVRKVLILPFAYEATQRRLALGVDLAPLFATERGHRLHHSNFARRWRAAREELGMDWRFHDLRHTYATLLIQGGVSSVALCAMLGHSKPSVTYDIYAGFFTDPVSQVREEMRQ